MVDEMANPGRPRRSQKDDERIKELGARLKEVRKKVGLSQEQVAIFAEQGVVTIQKWEQGQAEPGSLGIRKFADVCGVDLASLYMPAGHPIERLGAHPVEPFRVIVHPLADPDDELLRKAREAERRLNAEYRNRYPKKP